MDSKERIMKFINGDKKRITLIAVAVIGVLLILLSLGGGDESTADTPDGSLEEYKANLEAELAELCSSVSGAGQCKVTVSFSEGEKTEYRGTSKISTTPPKILGITVLAEGGDRAEVRGALTDCLTALFDIGANRVAVLKMK